MIRNCFLRVSSKFPKIITEKYFSCFEIGNFQEKKIIKYHTFLLSFQKRKAADLRGGLGTK